MGIAVLFDLYSDCCSGGLIFSMFITSIERTRRVGTVATSFATRGDSTATEKKTIIAESSG
jgi:hypothetical protein